MPIIDRFLSILVYHRIPCVSKFIILKPYSANPVEYGFSLVFILCIFLCLIFFFYINFFFLKIAEFIRTGIYFVQLDILLCRFRQLSLTQEVIDDPLYNVINYGKDRNSKEHSRKSEQSASDHETTQNGESPVESPKIVGPMIFPSTCCRIKITIRK